MVHTLTSGGDSLFFGTPRRDNRPHSPSRPGTVWSDGMGGAPLPGPEDIEEEDRREQRRNFEEYQNCGAADSNTLPDSIASPISA